MLAGEMMRFSSSWLGDDEFWIVNLCMLTVYATSFALAFFAAAGMITFTSENRSTPLRICMLRAAGGVRRMDGLRLDWDAASARFDFEVILVMAIAGRHLLVRDGHAADGRAARNVAARAAAIAASTLARLFFTLAESGAGQRLHVRGRQRHGDRRHVLHRAWRFREISGECDAALAGEPGN